jgi:uncharacterized RDD family membrane protein YckC
MIRSFRLWLAAATLAVLAAAPSGAAAQNIDIRLDEFDNPALRILQDYNLRSGDTARHVVVIGGDAKIEGRVTEDVVVVLGKAELASTAVIEGSFVVIGGSAEIAEGAKVGRDFVAVGGALTPPSFQPGGQHVVIGTAGLGDSLRSLVPWLTHGLLLGRPIVPWLGWVWLAAAVFFFLNLCLNLIFDVPLRSVTTTLRTTPFSAFMAGLLVLLLAGPVCVLLAISVIGIAVIPFVLCALLVAGILGRIAFARWLGMSLFHQSEPDDRAQSLRSFVTGSALMCVAYMIPFVGFILWILAGVFGLGAATLAFYSSYRRENPRPPKKVAVPPQRPVEPAAPMDPIVPVETLGVSSLQAEDFREAPPADSVSMNRPHENGSYPVSIGGALALPRAAFAERLGALALDAIAIGIIAQLLSLDHHGDPGERLMVFLALIYHVGFWTWRGTTPGGMICQLRVVRTDGKPLDFPESLVRGLTGIISLAVVGLGFLWMLRDPERQTWHDRVAGTYVVKVPRAYAV